MSTSLLASFALSKNKKSEALWLIVGPPYHSQCYISLSVWCVFCSFTSFLSVLFVFHRKSLVLLHLMNRYTTSTTEYFRKRKYIVEKEIFDISELFSVIQIAVVSTWQIMLIYIYMGVSVYWSVSMLVILVCMWVKHISRSFWY